MNYLTNYYINLCEQLQGKISNLEQLLEYRKRSIVHLDVSDVDPYTGEDVPRIMGREVTKKGNPLGKGARKEKIFSTYPGMGAIRNMGNDQDALAWEIVSNSGRPTVQDNPIYASMLGKGPALEVGSGEVFHNRSDMRRKGRSEPGMGKKFKKKNLAIQLAKIEAQKAARLKKQIKESRGGGYGRMPHDDASREYAEDIAREWSDIARGEEEFDRESKGPTKFSIVDKISGSMHGQGDESTYLVHGDDGYHYTVAPHYGKAQWAYDNEDLGQAPKTFELGPKQRETFDIIDRIDNPKNPDHQELIKRYKIKIRNT